MADPTDPDQTLLDEIFTSLTPDWTGDPDLTTSSVPTTVVPVPKLYGDFLFGALRGVVYPQGGNSWLKLVMYTPGTGAPMRISVGSYSTAPAVQVKFREATGLLSTVYIPDTGDEPSMATDGTYLLLPVPIELRDAPGVYRGQSRVLAEDGSELARDEFLVLVQRGMWNSAGDTPDDKGPPTVLEVRSALRDHPAANRLLGDFEFQPAEIGQALVSAVQDWNQSFPPGPQYVTTNFPIGWRRNWLDSAVAYLLETAANYARRGHLPYSAGGVSVDDLDREKEYLSAAQFYRERWSRFVKMKKTEISVAAAWGSQGSNGPGVRVGHRGVWP